MFILKSSNKLFEMHGNILQLIGYMIQLYFVSPKNDTDVKRGGGGGVVN
jgi:hypothetical protein